MRRVCLQREVRASRRHPGGDDRSATVTRALLGEAQHPQGPAEGSQGGGTYRAKARRRGSSPSRRKAQAPAALWRRMATRLVPLATARSSPSRVSRGRVSRVPLAARVFRTRRGPPAGRPRQDPGRREHVRDLLGSPCPPKGAAAPGGSQRRTLSSSRVSSSLDMSPRKVRDLTCPSGPRR